MDRKDVLGNYSPDNCRWVPRYVNAQNKRLIRKNNTSEYCGIIQDKRTGHWWAKIGDNGKTIYFKTCNTREEVAALRDAYIIEHNTEHPLNNIL